MTGHIKGLKKFQELPLKKMESTLQSMYNNKIDYELIDENELKLAKNDMIKQISYEAYGESAPQAILQMYTLWKKPLACIHWNFTNGKFSLQLK